MSDSKSNIRFFQEKLHRIALMNFKNQTLSLTPDLLRNHYEKMQKSIIADLQAEEDKIVIDAYLKRKGDIKTFFPEKLSQKLKTLFQEQTFLSARVYALILEIIQGEKHYKIQNQQEINALSKLIKRQRVFLSFNRYVWNCESNFYRYKSGSSSDQEKENAREKMIKLQKNCPLLKQIHQFLISINLMDSGQNDCQNNKFLMQLQRITKDSNKEQLIFDASRILLQDKSQNLPNYYFYINESTKRIQQLHKQQGNYTYLQDRHDYIQWMFPNHYGSAFNSSAKALTYTQAQLFKHSMTIGANLLISVAIFFDFMGIELSSTDISLRVINLQRLVNVIQRFTHNHLRIMRILACLSVTGFRKIAVKLIELLDKITEKGQRFSQQRRTFEKNWAIYSDKSDRAKSMCFLQLEQFPEDHSILKLFYSKEKQSQMIQESKEKTEYHKAGVVVTNFEDDQIEEVKKVQQIQLQIPEIKNQEMKKQENEKNEEIKEIKEEDKSQDKAEDKVQNDSCNLN